MVTRAPLKIMLTIQTIKSVSDIKDSFPETNNNNDVCLLVSYP